MAISVKKRSKIKPWKDSSLGYADPTAGVRTKVKNKPTPQFETMEARKGGQIDEPGSDNIPIIRPKKGTSKKRVGKPKVPSKKIRDLEFWNLWKEPPKTKEKSSDVEAYGGGKVKYRSIGGKVVDGNEITGMIYN